MMQQMPAQEPPEESPLKEPSLECLATYLKTCTNVVVLCGAGISTSAGIPDFRTPGTGLYDNIQKYLDKYNVQSPQDLFSYEMFKENPKPFYELAKDIKYPQECIKPTVAHHFLKLLHDKGVLLRVYTQNIDMLESEIGIIFLLPLGCFLSQLTSAWLFMPNISYRFILICFNFYH